MSPFRKYRLIVHTGLLIIAIRVALRMTSLPRLLHMLHVGKGARTHNGPTLDEIAYAVDRWLTLFPYNKKGNCFPAGVESVSVCTSVWSAGRILLRCEEIGNNLGRPCMADALGQALHGTHATVENIRGHVFLSTVGFTAPPSWPCRHKLRHVPVLLRFAHLIFLLIQLRYSLS